MAEINFETDIIEMRKGKNLHIMKEKHPGLVVDLEEKMTTQMTRTPMEDDREEEEVVGLLAVRSSFRGLAFFL